MTQAAEQQPTCNPCAERAPSAQGERVAQAWEEYLADLVYGNNTQRSWERYLAEVRFVPKKPKIIWPKAEPLEPGEVPWQGRA